MENIDDGYEVYSYILEINLVKNLKEEIVIYDYYSILDIVSELGGIFASINGALASIAIFTVIHYIYTLASIIRRKAKYWLKQVTIKRTFKVIPII